MFGLSYISFDASNYILHYRNGAVVREGQGLSFYYYSPNSSIVAIPLGSNDLPFIFQEVTSDYQQVSVQGQITYKVSKPRQLAEILDFTVDNNRNYKKKELEKLNQRIINEAQTVCSEFFHGIGLKDAIRSGKNVGDRIFEGLRNSTLMQQHGISILSINIMNVKPTPEMSRALETEMREKLQQNADLAIYERRNFAVEQERKIRESEFNTEIAVEEKKKQVEEKKMHTDVLLAENDQKLREMKIAADIIIEEQRKIFLVKKSENEMKEAEVKGYAIEAMLKPYRTTDWKTIAALSNNGDSKGNIALAFRELAERAGSINQLNITPDLLQSLMQPS